MVDLKLATSILGVLYEKWFENYVVGISWRDVDKCVMGDKNEISKAVEFLESEYLIQRHNGWYRITSYGLEKYEETLPPSSSSKRLTQRKKILEILKIIYDKNVNQDLEDKELTPQIGDIAKFELLGQVEYLESKGYVKLMMFGGGSFLIRLTANGASTFEKYEVYDYQVMSSAYRTLFLLENNLRNFLEKKLYEKYGSEWWNKGISAALQAKADERSKEEKSLGFVISVRKSNMEYLSFPDLSKIIVNQWKEIFESIFKEQSTIDLKLKELEDIRNAIAHTRTLSSDSMNRLEQYNSDILNLIQK